ncbi:MAG: hypothetical protein ACP5JG_02485 [Anaerolineae bacterium]
MVNDERVVAELISHPNPSVRVLARTKLAAGSFDDASVREDRALVSNYAPVRDILEAQYPEGYWMHSGFGVSPRYRATVWQLLFLAQLGLGPVPEARRALGVVLRDNVDEEGAARLHKGEDGRSLALTSALLWSAASLDLADEVSRARFRDAWSWVNRQVLGRAIAGPEAIWLARAIAAWRCKGLVFPDVAPVRAALKATLSEDRTAPLCNALTFPLTLQPDALGWMEAWVALGQPTRIPSRAFTWLMSRRLPSGNWPAEHVPGPLWCDVGRAGESNPWVTIRALVVVRACKVTSA